MAEKKQAKLIIKGKVQGVFFRDFAKQNANKMGLTGWAKNRRDGALSVLVQGDKDKIKEFTKLCKKGPMMAKVDDVFVEWQETAPDEGLERFDIRYI